MNLHQEYKPQIILATIQSFIIMAGCLVVGMILKTRGFNPDIHHLSFKISLIRNYGFLLILIPLTWVCFTIFWERSHTNHFTKRGTIITGSILLIALCFYFSATALKCLIARVIFMS